MASCHPRPSNRIMIWAKKSMIAPVIKVCLLSVGRLEATPPQTPLTNAAMGNASRKPPVGPVKCCHPDAFSAKMGAPNPPIIR